MHLPSSSCMQYEHWRLLLQIQSMSCISNNNRSARKCQSSDGPYLGHQGLFHWSIGQPPFIANKSVHLYFQPLAREFSNTSAHVQPLEGLLYCLNFRAAKSFRPIKQVPTKSNKRRKGPRRSTSPTTHHNVQGLDSTLFRLSTGNDVIRAQHLGDS